MKLISIVLLILVLSSAAYGQCPSAINTWSTTTGTMLGGRASEAWCGAGYPVQPGVPGNTQNAMSWDGATLGSQWKAWNMQIDADGAVLISDTVDGSGNGLRTYTTDYVGGQFWLAGSHNWSDGVDLVGPLTSFHVVATITYVGGNAVGATSNISFTGDFDDCPDANNCEITFTIANAMLVWSAASGLPAPVNYPPLLCDASAGEDFDVCCITMQINCAVPDEEVSWGGLKATYR